MGHGSASNLDPSKPPSLVMARHGVWLGTAFGSETERDKGSIVGGAALRSASRGCRVQWDRGQRVPHRELEVAKRELRPLLNALRFIESSNRLNCPDGDAGSSIGPLQISEEYHRDAWGHRAGRWTACRELAHAEDTVVRYWLRYCPGAIRAHDWELLAKFHNGGPRGTKQSKTNAYWRKVVRHLSAQQSLALSPDVPHIPPQLPGTFRAEGLAAEGPACPAASGAASGFIALAVEQHKRHEQVNETLDAAHRGRVVNESEPCKGGHTHESIKPGRRRPQHAVRPVPWRSPRPAGASPSPSLASAAHGAALAAISALPPLDGIAVDGDADVAFAADIVCQEPECALPLASPVRAPHGAAAAAAPAAAPAPVLEPARTRAPHAQCPGGNMGSGDMECAAASSLAEARSGSGWLLWDSDLTWPAEHHDDFFTPAASLDVQDAGKEHRGASAAADVADKLANLDIEGLMRGLGRGAGAADRRAAASEAAAAERKAAPLRAAKCGMEGSGDSVSALQHSRSAGVVSSSASAGSRSAIGGRHGSEMACEERRRASREAPRDASRRVEEWLRLVDGGRARSSEETTDGVNGKVPPMAGASTGSTVLQPLPPTAALHRGHVLRCSSVPRAGVPMPARAARAAGDGAWHVGAVPSAADKVEAWVHGHGGAAAVQPALTC
ncbi:hypothetical protein CLOM_g22415 [Closterium sp. NIES-68]|nr:hypothetical protein CLOM_g22415 [Closterium sp. NIES-68]